MEKKKIIAYPLKPFFFLYMAQFLLIPFHFSNEPILYQLNVFRVEMMGLILPLVILNLPQFNEKVGKYLKLCVYIAIAISTIYGLSLILTPGVNAYTEMLTPLASKEDVDQTNVLEEGVRIFGYLSSCYFAVTEFGTFLIFSSVFVLNDILGKRIKHISFLLLCLIGLNLFVCGSRSPLMAAFCIFLLFCVVKRKFKIILSSSLALSIILIAIYLTVPELLTLYMSIGDDSITGSSASMRLDQFRGGLSSIADNPIFGNGYGWTSWYRTEIGRHPQMLSFESILIQILCNNGIMGVLIWMTFCVCYLKTISRFTVFKSDSYFAYIYLIVGFFAYTFFTGDYGYMKILMIFYSILIVQDGALPKLVHSNPK